MKGTRKSAATPAHGRGTGVPDPVDVYVGSRIRARRVLIGMNQETLARKLGLTFQQVQKYEGGANRVSSSRLQEVADALEVEVDYFFAGAESLESESPEEREKRDLVYRPDSLELIRMYHAIADQRLRGQFLELVKATRQAPRPSEMMSRKR